MQLLEQIQSLRFPAPLPPKLLAVSQQFDASCVEDPAAATRLALTNSGMLGATNPGDTVAVGVGSRGIANLATIVRTVISGLHEAGLKPFIIPAMGSHAGATVEGQEVMLAQLGITAESVGAAVKATMDVVQIGQIEGGPPLYQDVFSTQADHSLLINRVKPHTAFRGKLESGLAKMAVIGLGKQKGAAAMHALGIPAFQNYLAPAARIYEAETNLLGGIAILENAYDQTAEILGLTAAEIGGPKELDLTERSRTLMASIPFPEFEILVVKQAGKNISGTGLDPNIIGRLMIPGQPEDFGGPDIILIAVLALTEATHGNGHGIGLANIISARVARQIDWQATYTNALTAGILGMQRSSMPITLPTDEAAVQIAVRNCGQSSEAARMVFIQDTLTLDHLWVSPNLQEAVQAHPRLSIEGELELAFDTEGNMISPWRM